jgi:HlyD family secretion protein
MMKPTTAKTSASTRDESRPARNGRKRSTGWRRLIPILLGVGLVVTIISALRPRPIPVEVATVSTGPLTVSVLEEGKTRIRHRYTISPPVTGLLTRVELRAGAPIKAGETVLATLQPQPSSFLDPRSQAEGEARVKATEAARKQRSTQIERAKASLLLAEKELVRARDLKQSGAIATKEWDAAENQVNVLTRELNAAEFALQVADFEYAQAEATVLIQAKNPSADKVEPYKIMAPVNGYVLNVFEESSRVVTPGTQIMEVGDPHDLEAEIELLSSDAVGVRPDAPVSIEQWGGDKPLRARVTIVEPGGFTKISALGVEEQRVKVRVDFIDPLPPGRFLGDRYRVEARIITWHNDSVLQVPTGALFRRGGDWMTFLVDGNKARLSKVNIAHNNGTIAEVTGGLKQNQTVIVHPPDAVADGHSVQARNH